MSAGETYCMSSELDPRAEMGSSVISLICSLFQRKLFHLI